MFQDFSTPQASKQDPDVRKPVGAETRTLTKRKAASLGDDLERFVDMLTPSDQMTKRLKQSAEKTGELIQFAVDNSDDVLQTYAKYEPVARKLYGLATG